MDDIPGHIEKPIVSEVSSFKNKRSGGPLAAPSLSIVLFCVLRSLFPVRHSLGDGGCILILASASRSMHMLARLDLVLCGLTDSGDGNIEGQVHPGKWVVAI